MVPTADARITRQMLYSATPPATTFVRVAILSPLAATVFRGGVRKTRLRRMFLGIPLLPFATCSSDLPRTEASQDLSDGTRESHRSYMGWVKLSRMYFVLREGRG